MEIRFDAKFDRDLRRIRDPDMSRRINQAIENVKSASTITEVPGIRRLSARGNFYRIRLGSYRIGVESEGDAIIFKRFGHRREIYRNFP